jgi:hypothetical protein
MMKSTEGFMFRQQRNVNENVGVLWIGKELAKRGPNTNRV